MQSTGIVYSPDFLAHDTGAHPEQPSRVSLAKKALDHAGNILWLDPREITDSEILWCHTEEHLDRIHEASSRAAQRRGIALDPDTVMSGGSLRAAKLGGGGLLNAIDAVLAGHVQNAFVLGRPPGHHATPDRAMGFCFFNNVAIGARYIQERHNLEKVLIVDWDVHHGNGTQDIFYSTSSVFFFSIHQFPHYPGTGSALETGMGAGKGYTLNVPLPGGTAAADHVAAFNDGLRRAVEKLRPDFILLSAGFDAHRDDPLGDMNLTDDDFAAMTHTLRHVAEDCCEGRLVATLEGGYNLSTLPFTISRHILALSEN